MTHLKRNNMITAASRQPANEQAGSACRSDRHRGSRIARKTTCILMSIVMVLGLNPGFAYATDTAPTQPQATEQNQATSPDVAPQENASSADDQPSATGEDATTDGQQPAADEQQPAEDESGQPVDSQEEATNPEAGTEEQFSAGTLETEIVTADGRTFKVMLDYDADAEIPEGTELSVIEIKQEPSEPNWQEDPEYKDRPLETEQFISEKAMKERLEVLADGLELKDELDESIYYSKLLDISLKADDKTVEPKAEVTITIETDELAEPNAYDEDATVAAKKDGVVIVDEDAAQTLQVARYTSDKKDADELDADVDLAQAVDPVNLLGWDLDVHSTVSFDTDDLSEFALAGVVRPEELAEEIEEPEEAVEEAVEEEPEYAEEEEESEEEEDAVESAAPKTLMQVIAASDGKNYKITATYDDSTGIPTDAELIVSEIVVGTAAYDEYVEQAAKALGTSIDDIGFACAFDISLRSPVTGEEYQPTGDVVVSIEPLNDSLSDYENVDVVHFAGDADKQPEVVDSAVKGETVEFETDGFSVYVLVVGSETVTPRRTYQFHVWEGDATSGGYALYEFYSTSGVRTSSVTVKNGEKPTIPQPPSKDETHPFSDWYQDIGQGSIQLADKPYDFDSEITEDELVELYAVYENQAYVIFHDQYSTEKRTFPIADTRRGAIEDGATTTSVKISDVTTTYNDGNNMAFYGWSYTPITVPGQSLDDNGDPIVRVPTDANGCITISGETHLYPIYKNIKWLTFWSGPTGSGATYYPVQYFFDGVGPDKLSVPEWNGHTFIGWYAGTVDPVTEQVTYGNVMIADAQGNLIDGAEDGGMVVYDNALHLTTDATLCAKWSDQVEYKILVWRQKPSDTQGSANKHYDLAESVTLTGVAGEEVNVPDQYKQYTEGIYSKYGYSRCDGPTTVSDDGNTILNVYYDVIFPYTSSDINHTMTFTDSVTGEGVSSMPDPVSAKYGTELSEPTAPTSAREHYSFGGWYADYSCTIPVFFHEPTDDELDSLKVLVWNEETQKNEWNGTYSPYVVYSEMPDFDVSIYAGWEAQWFKVTIDPNYGALYAYNDKGQLEGSGATWFWEDYNGQPIQEYQHVKRDFVESSSGTWYYVKHDEAYYGNGPVGDRYTYYTQDPNEATEYKTFEKAPNVYRYAGWYEVASDGSEEPYVFGQKVDHDTTLRLHWKKIGNYYLRYVAGDVVFDDTNVYADNAEIVVTREATAPEGYTFAGWRIQGDPSETVYSIGESFTLNADYASSISGKETLTLVAVFARLDMAKVVYDFNGGTFSGTVDDFNFGSPKDTHAPTIGKELNTTEGTATVSNLVNNSDFKLSSGAGLAMANAEFKGWSTERIYDPGKDTLFDPGSTYYGVDVNEPVTLYAVWEVDVVYHLGDQDGASWGDPSHWNGYTHDSAANTYSKTVYRGNVVSEPEGIPTCTGTSMFYYWVTPDTSTTAYDFTSPVSSKLDLYAYWAGPVTVPVHAVDASSETMATVPGGTSGWTISSAINVGSTEVELPGGYITAPDTYRLAFVAAHDRTAGLQTISEDEEVTAVYYNQSAKHLYVRYSDGTVGELNETYDLYYIYYQEKTLSVAYDSMNSDGELVSIPSTSMTGNPPSSINESGTFAEYDVTGTLATPRGWVNNSYGYYAYAIGSANAADASDLSLITTASGSDSSRPTLRVKNSWRGFHYTTEAGDEAAWIDCGYSPVLYVVYFTQLPTVVIFQEQTVGNSTVLNTEFTYDLLVSETDITTISVLTQRKLAASGGDNWEDVGTVAGVPVESGPRTVFDTKAEGNTSYKLKDGEANSAILFYSKTESRAAPVSSGTEPDENGYIYQTISITTTETAQKAVITQAKENGFTTAINDVQQTAEPYQYACVAEEQGGTKTATFTNTHEQMQVEVHVARIENGTIKIRDDLITGSNSFNLPISTSANLLSKLPANSVYSDADGVYTFGTVVVGNDAGSVVSVEQMGVESVTYGQVKDNHYELLLNDETGTSLGALGNQKIYYLYYPMPRIQYVQQSGRGDNKVLSLVQGSLNGETASDAITYDFKTFKMNGLDVVQNQRITLPSSGLVISQASSSSNFKMPPILDDKTYQRYLSYDSIAVGSALTEANPTLNVNALAGISHIPEMRLRINDNALQWSLDGVTWNDMGADQTIFAIYTERGYDLQISKVVDTSVSGENPIFTDRIFTVTITCNPALVPGDKYYVDGAESPTAVVDESGKLVFTVVDGSKIKISGLGHGEYTITESNNENFDLSAKVGPIVGTATEELSVSNSSVKVTLDTEKQVVLTNTPQAICKIEEPDNVEHLFYTFADAMEYVENYIPDFTASIQMLVDYLMPAEDTLQIPSNAHITLITATEGDHHYGTGRAVISRNQTLSDKPMIVNNGELILQDVTLNGGSFTASAPMIQSNRDLKVTRGVTLQNAKSSGNGGAIAASGNVSIEGQTSGQSVTSLLGNQASNGGLLYYSGLGSGTVTVSGGLITGNSATENGGAIYIDKGTLAITGGSIAGNYTTQGNGGAIYAASGVVTLSSNASLSGNQALNGGAIYADAASVEMSGGDVSGNSVPPAISPETPGNGGAICTNSGTITISGGTLARNSAQAGYGGAIYTNKGTVNVSGGTIGSSTDASDANRAKNGSAVFIQAGAANLSGGTIKGNAATEGGAVGVGVENDETTAKLYFSGGILVTGNTMGTSGSAVASNVYLDADSNAVINATGLNGNANVGIYVPDKEDDKGVEYLFKNRGSMGAQFGTYTSDSNISKFRNDRQPSLGVTTNSTSMKLLWGTPIKVEIRYLENYSAYPDGFPPRATSTSKYSSNSYYPTSSNMAISGIGEDLRDQQLVNLGTSVYAVAFVEGATQYTDYITRLVWEDTNGDGNYVWKYVDKSGTTKTVLDTNKKIIVYYAEPTYISIENNTNDKLVIDSMTVLGQNVVGDYGLVFARNGAKQTELLPVSQNDLTLDKNESINILVPGGSNQAYQISGSFINPSAPMVKLRRTGFDDIQISTSEAYGWSANTAGKGETASIVYGEDKQICKIVDSSGEHPFPTIKGAIDYANRNNMVDVTIQMLVDYMMPASDVLNLRAADTTNTIRSLTLTTAKTGEYRYGGERATISRDPLNTTNPLVTIYGSAGAIDMTLNVTNLDFDGKNLAGNCDGGAIKTNNCTVTINDSDYKGFVALNGGAVFVSFGEELNRGNKKYEYNFSKFPGGSQYPTSEGSSYDYSSTALLTVTNSKFVRCESLATNERSGGGAIWTNAKILTMNRCEFDTCKSIYYKAQGGQPAKGSVNNQGGAVFHRIDGSTQKNYAWQPYAEASTSNFNGCTFTGCEAMAGGGMESDAHNLNATNCTFVGCITHAKDGGAINCYIFEQSYSQYNGASKVALNGCSFIGCTSARNGGALRSLARETEVKNCTFTNTKAQGGGGAIAATNTVAHTLMIEHSTFEGADAYGNTRNEYQSSSFLKGGGAIYTCTRWLTIKDQSSISNCQALKTANGGAIYQSNDFNGNADYTNKSFALIQDSIIDGCTATQHGGAYYTNNVRSVTIENSTVQNCTATSGSGGGICYDTTNGPLTIKGSTVKGNKVESASGQGGGIYCKKTLKLQNATIIENILQANNANENNAAGVYIYSDGDGTLEVGDPAQATNEQYFDHTRIEGNTTKNGKPSNLRLPESNGVNRNSVTVNCNLGSGDPLAPIYIYVVNAKNVGTQFGKSLEKNPAGVTDTDAVFRADSSTLRGVIDRQATGTLEGKKVIWAGPPICKVTDADGRLLYFKDNGSDPAIFDVLDNGTTSGRTSAFSMLRQPPKLYYAPNPEIEGAKGEEYTGKAYCVKMMVEQYELTNQITMVDSNEIAITLTTAGKRDNDGYPLDPYASGDRATIIRGDGVTGSMVVARANMNFENIVLDGNETSSNENGAIVRVEGTKDITVVVGSKAILQRGNATNGGAVAVANGTLELGANGLIRFCKATGNGGGVYLGATGSANGNGVFYISDGKIQQCEAANGGGVYVDKGRFDMAGGGINGCTAYSAGGGVYMGAGKVMNMSGGRIGYEMANHAGTKGGGIAIGGAGVQLNFTRQVTIANNTCDQSVATGHLCNVELDLDDNTIIRTTGLYSRSLIGVYVPGTDNGPEAVSSQYDKHGGEADPFGYYEGSSSQLYCFVNDRNKLKGGLIANPAENTIYWIKIFTIKVGKEVDVSENVSNAIKNKANTDEFVVNVRLWDTDNNVSGIKVADIVAEIEAAEAVGEASRFGDIRFETTSAPDLIEATVRLKNGEEISAENLPDGLGYSVTEQKIEGYAAIPTNQYNGSTGENKNRESEGIDPYVSDVKLTNMLPSCKVTDENGNVLYVKQGSYMVPAVYKEVSDAYRAVNSNNGNKAFYTENSSISFSGNFHIEMLVPEYTLTGSLRLTTNRTLMVTTADTSAKDNFPFLGTGTTSTVKRSSGFTNGSMLTMDNGKKLTLKNINFDGNQVQVNDGVNGGIVNVPNGGHLTVLDGAALKNSRISGKGAGVYLDTGGTLQLSGNPTFGGQDTDAYGWINNRDGNFAGAIDSTPAQMNGNQSYTVKHQDIYISENRGDHPATVVLIGKLTGAAGSIWVWAENESHYKQLMPFAKIDGEGADESSFNIFRNARYDSETENETDGYLYGTDDGQIAGYVYWNGVSDFIKAILKKTDDVNGAPLEGASFTLYRTKAKDSVVKDKAGRELTNLQSDSMGVLYLGWLPYSKNGSEYWLYEDTPPASGTYENKPWFKVTINETGITIGAAEA